MPPKKDQHKDKDNNTRIDDYIEEIQPPWARRMEETLLQRFDDVKTAMTMCEEKLQDLEQKTTKRFSEIDDRFQDAEYHQRKYNLLIFGLKFQKDNCEDRVREFIRDGLEIEEEPTMIFHHCHPLPSRNGSACIVRFVRFKDKEKVLSSLVKLKGKNMRVTVRTDLPRKLREKRSDLQKELTELKKTDRARVLRVAERGQDVFLEEKKAGKWTKVM